MAKRIWIRREQLEPRLVSGDINHAPIREPIDAQR
jgi:hypothetical protein